MERGMYTRGRLPVTGAIGEPAGGARLVATFRVGELEISQLSDGFGTAPRRSWFAGIDPQVWMPTFGIVDADTPFAVNFGGFLVVGDGHVTLVDAGLGAPGLTRAGLAGGGRMLERLAEIGVDRHTVDRVVLTHMHSDHVGHLSDAAAALTFPDAAVHVNRDELDYWTTSTSDDNPMSTFVRSRISGLLRDGRVRTFAGEHALSASVTAIPTPGHTPGHCSVVLCSAGQTAILLGDVAHHPVHLEHHGWLPDIDLDPAESQRSRARVAGFAADHQAVVVGPHMPVLTLGYVERRPDGCFGYVPAECNADGVPVRSR